MLWNDRGAEERPYWRGLLWLRRHRIRGRSWFVWQIGVVRFGIPVAILATIVRVFGEDFRLQHLALHLAVNTAAGIVGGYVAGRVLWDLLVDR